MTVVVADIKRTVSLRINRLVAILEAAAAASTTAASITAAAADVERDSVHQSNTASSTSLSVPTAGLNLLSSHPQYHDVVRLFSRWKQLPHNNYHE